MVEVDPNANVQELSDLAHKLGIEASEAELFGGATPPACPTQVGEY